MTPIDNGFILISATDAKKLAGKLPAVGNEKLVKHKDKHYWLSRTPYNGKMVWSIRETAWRLVNGQAVLGWKALA